MAASAWVIYNDAKRSLMDGTLDIDNEVWRLALFTSASNAATATLLVKTSVTGEVTSANGYTVGGNALTVTWSIGASASEMRFDATATSWSAGGGSISAVKYAVIFASGGNELLCYSTLTTAQFEVTDTNSLTITPAATGIFELN